MSRFAAITLLGLAAGLACVPAAGGAVPTAGVGPLAAAWTPDADGPFDDPFPIRRVRVTDAQLAELPKTVGPLVRLTRDDFETRVRRAARVAHDSHQPVRLVEARYKAVLGTEGLVGTAAWTLVNPNRRAAAFALDPFRLAVRSAAWADGADAVLGVLGPGFPAGPAVWVDTPGRRELTVGWSAGGTAEPGERRFDVRVPPCPVASLDLDLPADRVPTAAADALLSGPFPAADGRRAWRFRFAGSRLEFGVRSVADAPAGRGPVRAGLAARYDLVPGQAACTFEYDIRPGRATGEWAFDADPALRITDVVVNDRAGWDVEPPAEPGKPATLRVRLREPSPGGKVLVSALAPLPATPDTPLPMLRPRNGLVGDERVDVRIHPDLKPGGWAARDFRLADAGVGADRFVTLGFVGSVLPPGADRPFRQPPGVGVVAAGPDYTTREAVEWRVDGGRPVVVARVAVHVRRGPLFALPVQLPAGFAVARLSATPDDSGVFLAPPAGTPPTATVEFPRPVATGQGVELVLELRGPPLTTQARLPVPRLAFPGAAERDGTFAVGPAPGVDVSPQWAGVPDPADARSVVPFRGREPEGFLRLAPRPPEWAAESETTVTTADGTPTATTRLTVRVTAGAVTHLTVLVPESGGGGRTWRVTAGDNAVPSATSADLGDMAGFLAPLAGGAALPVPGGPLTAWRLTLARPADGAFTLETSAPLAGPTGVVIKSPLTELIPLFVAVPTVIACPTQPATIQLDRVTAATYTLGAARRDRVTGVDARRPTRMPMRPTARTADRAAGGWAYADLYQLTAVGGADWLTAVFGGRVTAAGGGELPVRFPPGAVPVAAVVGGRWVSPEADAVADGATVRLPIPAGGGVPFEVRYRLPVAYRFGVAVAASPRPDVPGGAAGCTRTWLFGGDVEPVRAVADGAATADAPLTGPLPLAPGRRTRWTPADDTADADDVTVVLAPVAAGGRVGLAAAVVAAGWWAVGRGRRAGRRVAVAVGILGLTGAVFAADAGTALARPPLVAGAVVVAALVVARVRPWRRFRVPARRTATAVLVAIWSLTLQTGLADPPEPATAYVVAGDGGEVVLAPRAVLDRLDDVARPAAPTAVVTGAEYDGSADDATARFTVRYAVTNFAPGPAAVVIPLGDVRLERVAVDGADAFPTAAGADAYAVDVPPGTHAVTAAFAVPVTAAGADREARFGVPDVPAGRLRFTAPAGARQLQLAGWHGGQGVTAGAGGPRLTADLGGGRAVVVRWRQGAGGGATVVRAKDVAVWDVAEGGATLTAAALFRVEQGTVSAINFDLPADVEPVRVLVRSPDAPPGAGAVLRDWFVPPDSSKPRPLRVRLQAPAEGRVLVVLDLAPRHPPGRQTALRFPKPRATAVESVYAVRARGVTADETGRTGLADAPPDALTRELAGVIDTAPDPAATVRAFRPTGAGPAELRLAVRPPGEAVVSRDTLWRVGDGPADGGGTLRWAGAEAAAVEFDLPAAVRVLEVRGDELAGWSRHGPRVQAWFRKAVKDPAVEWVGVLPANPMGKGAADPVVFEPPVPRPVGGAPGPAVVRVRPGASWGVRVDRDRGWVAVPPAAGVREWAYRTDAAVAVAPRWHLSAGRPLPPASGFASVEFARTTLTYRATTDQRLTAGRPTVLALRVGNLPPGATADVDVPGGVKVTGHTTTNNVREWSLDVPVGADKVVRVGATVRAPAATADIGLPSITLGPAGGKMVPAVQWLGVGPSAPRRRVTGAAGGDAARAAWPAEVDRVRKGGGSVWAVPPTGPGVRLVAAVEPVPKAAAVEPAAGPPRPAGPATIPPPTAGPSPGERVLAAGTWLAAAVAVAVMAVRFPRSTWPEQVALLAGLAVIAVGGNPLPWGAGVIAGVRGGGAVVGLFRRRGAEA